MRSCNSIGGGSAVSIEAVRLGMRLIGVGVGWNSNLICGDMTSRPRCATSSTASRTAFPADHEQRDPERHECRGVLPALIIQRADPNLYNLLTNGVLQARLDFDRSS